MKPTGDYQRPVIIGVDGRSGAGKTTLALELAALLRKYRKVSVFHLEDIYPGWNGLEAGIDRYVSTVLAPLAEGRPARWSSWDWSNHYDGEQRTTAAADVVVVEGVGAASSAARPFLDAVIWLEAPAPERKSRALQRDGERYAPYWDQWAEQEDAMLAVDDPAGSADVLVEARTDGTAPTLVLRALASLPALELLLAPERASRRGLQLQVQHVDGYPEDGALFERLYGSAPHAVWLDSSNPQEGGDRSRFSIMADDDGPFGQLARHRSAVTSVSGGGVTARIHGPFFRWLDSEWGRRAVRAPEGFDCGFTLGWLGYLGYELKRETGGSNVAGAGDDACLLFAGRAVVVDHQQRCVFLLQLAGVDGEPDDGWLLRVRQVVESLPARSARRPAPAPLPLPDAEFTLRDSEDIYRNKIALALAEIGDGNSYEVCLTTEITAITAVEPATALLARYCALRAANPAPFASFLRLGNLTISSTSPERFLRISADGALRAEPIKGTRRRTPLSLEQDQALARELATSAKDRAENIMIVDLLRNDLFRFADPASVSVPRLCAIESYATVHQMVSTIDATLRPGASRAEAVAAAFPSGSMTGAPKISTMAILDGLEAVPRGVYSGAIGYFSLSGAADLSVTIRTLTARTDGASTRYSLGVGGAITADSSPAEEWQEVRAKAFGVLSVLGISFPDSKLDA